MPTSPRRKAAKASWRLSSAGGIGPVRAGVTRLFLIQKEGLGVLFGRDVVAAAVVGVPAAVAQFPDQGLGVRLLGAERQGVRVEDALLLQRLGRVLQVRPGLRRLRSRLVEQPLVVEEQSAAGHEGQAVESAVDRARVRERPQEVRLRPDRHDLAGGVEAALRGEVGVRAHQSHVGGVVLLDHAGDLAVDIGPRPERHLDLLAGMRGGEGGGQLVPVRLGTGRRAGAVLGGHQAQCRRVALGRATGGHGGSQESECGHGGGHPEESWSHGSFLLQFLDSASEIISRVEAHFAPY
ncbi:hypothetical protein STANM337S_06784 [Streptomyces tanashiensis]